MYLGIDVGATKTLVATFSESGEIEAQEKFPTPQDYGEFKTRLSDTFTQLGATGVRTAAVGMPGLVDRQTGISVSSGPNLAWRNSPLREDLGNLLNCLVVVENDANVAGLSEAVLVRDQYSRVLYVTVSTGIGGGVVFDGQLEPALLDSEVGQMVCERDGKIMRWEEFASGKAIVNTYGKKASDITDDAIWQKIARDLGIGFINCASVYNPLDAIIVGGGVGTHFERFGQHIKDFVEENMQNTVRKRPAIIEARHAEEAVIYGCYELARQTDEKAD